MWIVFMRRPEVEILPSKVGCQDELELDALVSGIQAPPQILFLHVTALWVGSRGFLALR